MEMKSGLMMYVGGEIWEARGGLRKDSEQKAVSLSWDSLHGPV